MRIALVIGT